MSVATLHPPPMLPAAEAWRCGRCVSWQERPLLTLSWALAVASASLAIGLVGLATPVEQPIHLLSYVPAPEGEEQGETALFELAAPLSGLEESLPSEPDTAVELEVADFLPEVVLPPLDLPELVEVLTQEAVFEVPAAPQVETALTPNEPTPPKPTPRPTAAPRSSSPPRATAPSGSGAATGGTPGGTGGTGTSARGQSKGYFPSPPYPAAARSRGMQGTVYLSITFGADGRATAVSVSRSSGYSELDRAASDWVKRNWRAPAGQVGTFRQPVQYRLR
jgi:protein TonB